MARGASDTSVAADDFCDTLAKDEVSTSGGLCLEDLPT